VTYKIIIVSLFSPSSSH